MIEFVCDYCGNVQEDGETWINGMAAENVGTKAARREVIIDPAWHYERAVAPLAVHFCCLDCKDGYMEELFRKPAALLKVQSVDRDPATNRRVIRARKVPAGKVAAQRGTKTRRLRTN
jgi:hypothetical protein